MRSCIACKTFFILNFLLSLSLLCLPSLSLSLSVSLSISFATPLYALSAYHHIQPGFFFSLGLLVYSELSHRLSLSLALILPLFLLYHELHWYALHTARSLELIFATAEATVTLQKNYRIQHATIT